MADKMMRIAGRGEDGLAKALKTDNSGRLEMFQPKRIKTILIYENKPIAAGEAFGYPIENFGGNKLAVFVRFADNVTVNIELENRGPAGSSTVGATQSLDTGSDSRLRTVVSEIVSERMLLRFRNTSNIATTIAQATMTIYY